MLVVACIGYVIMGASVYPVMGWGSPEHPIGMAFCLAPIYAFVTFSVVLVVAARTRRPLGVADLFRIVLWTIVGFGLGVHSMAGSYYAHFFPQRSDSMRTIGLAIVGVALFLVVMTFFVLKNPSIYGSGLCPHCGYDQRGHEYERCPECGHANGDEASLPVSRELS
jgi:uncharacterized membrane protein